MKTVFAVIGVITALIIGSVSVMAVAGNRHHDSDRTGHRAEKMIERLAGKLDLSDEQQTQLTTLSAEARPVMMQGRQMMKSLRSEMMDFSTMGADYETRMIQLADEQSELTRQMILQAADLKLKVTQILDDEQLVKLQELSAKFKDRRMGKRHGWRFGGHGIDSEDSVENGTADQ